MKTAVFAAIVVIAMCAAPAGAMQKFQRDVLRTSGGDLAITFIGHGSLVLEYANRCIHIDPYSPLADYSTMPKADVVLLTHHHRDHLDPAALKKVRTAATEVVCTQKCAETLGGGVVMHNGDKKTVSGIEIQAVPAYNLVHKRDTGQVFHPKGEGNGYVLTFGDKRLYIAGDTENIPEMKALKNIDVAFLPMNLPYTMTPAMVADAALAFKPRVLYPYHYGETDTAEIVGLLKGSEDIEVRIRGMK